MVFLRRSQPALSQGLLSIAFTIALLFVQSCMSLYFYPDRQFHYSPRKFGLEYEEVIFTSRDGTRLSAWYFSAKANGRGNPSASGLIVQFHGNAENMTSHFSALAWLVHAGYDLLSFDYRGYGRSEGEVEIEGVHQDGEALLRLALERYKLPGQPLIVYGQSLGGIILLKVLERTGLADVCDLVVIESSFTDYRAIARQSLSEHLLTWPIIPLTYLLVSNSYGVDEYLSGSFTRPLLVIHGDKDEVVSYRFGEEIFKMAQTNACLLTINGGTHNRSFLVAGGSYQKVVLGLISRLTGRGDVSEASDRDTVCKKRSLISNPVIFPDR